MMKHLSIFIATGVYSGYLRPFSGTWGTIPAWLIAFYLIQGNIILLTVTTVVVFFLSVWSAGEAEKLYGHDSKNIVIDEWAGMFITVLFVPVTLKAYIIAFILFRIFDVIKLYPAAQFEKLPGGWGVTMDDVAAGAYANVATQIVLFGITYFGI